MDRERRDDNGKTDHDHLVELKIFVETELPHISKSIKELKEEFICHRDICEKRFEKIDLNFDNGVKKFEDLDGWRNRTNGALGIIFAIWAFISAIIIGIVNKLFFNGGN